MRRNLEIRIVAALVAFAPFGCAPAAPPGHAAGAAGAADNLSPMNRVAESYVRLVLALGRHDADYVDAYYGPPRWKEEAESSKRPLADIVSSADALLAEIARLPEPSGEPSELLRQRRRYLQKQLSALKAKAEMLAGKKLSFDEESRALYDAVAPTNSEEHFRRNPGPPGRPSAGLRPPGRALRGVPERVRHSARQARRGLFRRDRGRARRHEGAHRAPRRRDASASSTCTDKTWSGYNWYQGGFRSLIQVNTDLPIFIDRAVDLACHEGYPGHHVYNVLLEKNLVRDRGWVEFTVYPLFSPQSLIAEGSANFGIEVAFPGAERTAFERDVLYPIAGIDPVAGGPVRRDPEARRRDCRTRATRPRGGT